MTGASLSISVSQNGLDGTKNPSISESIVAMPEHSMPIRRDPTLTPTTESNEEQKRNCGEFGKLQRAFEAACQTSCKMSLTDSFTLSPKAHYVSVSTNELLKVSSSNVAFNFIPQKLLLPL